jgi:colanic acid/amylovoran biosynthesis glycosyltransferase
VEGINLIVVSPLKAVLRPNRKILLTRKFVDGMALYRELWKGPIIHVCEPAQEASDNLDNIEVDLDTATFRTVCEKLSDDRLARLFAPRSLVLASIGERFNTVSRLSQEAGIPCVYITECSLPTRLQIVKEYQRTPLHGWWRCWRETKQERAHVRAISLANAVQCNGTPTYNAYRSLTPRPHLFFDTRIEEAMLATPAQISARSARFSRDRKLRLVFSGRLQLIKGVDHLPLVAAHLRRLGVPFEMSICGDGECTPQLRKDVAKMGLGEMVKLRGTLDFKTELVPFVTNETDLFVCCHRQGDPSCTYLETMACGVPIAGYGNEAFEGLAQVSGTGWVVPIGRPVELAERIAAIYRDPAASATAAHRSLAFARDHTFEKTFRRRVGHLDRVAASALVSSTM